MPLFIEQLLEVLEVAAEVAVCPSLVVSVRVGRGSSVLQWLQEARSSPAKSTGRRKASFFMTVEVAGLGKKRGDRVGFERKDARVEVCQ
jgi:hypothetical protein